MPRNKKEVVTFKVDPSLMEAMKGIENRSDFIRRAVVAALDSSCPLCKGTGVLTPEQKKHWDTFAKDHRVVECGECHEIHLKCEHSEDAVLHAPRGSSK